MISERFTKSDFIDGHNKIKELVKKEVLDTKRSFTLIMDYPSGNGSETSHFFFDDVRELWGCDLGYVYKDSFYTNSDILAIICNSTGVDTFPNESMHAIEMMIEENDNEILITTTRDKERVVVGDLDETAFYNELDAASPGEVAEVIEQ